MYVVNLRINLFQSHSSKQQTTLIYAMCSIAKCSIHGMEANIMFAHKSQILVREIYAI